MPQNVKYFFTLSNACIYFFFRRHFKIVKCVMVCVIVSENKRTISSENRNLFRLFSDLMEYGIGIAYRSIDSTLSTEETMSICNILLPFSSCHFNKKRLISLFLMNNCRIWHKMSSQQCSTIFLSPTMI